MLAWILNVPESDLRDLRIVLSTPQHYEPNAGVEAVNLSMVVTDSGMVP